MAIELFEPYRIGKLELRNRFVRSATWDATADDSGRVTDTSVALYGNLGRGEIGLIVSGYAYISLIGQAAVGQYSVHTDDMIPGLSRLVQAAHQGGAKIALQIVHAGINDRLLSSRKGITLLAVSKRPEINRPHRELTDEEIEEIISDFAAAALRGREAGFDAVQLHGAHAYLMSQIQSPLYNLRRDRWGGSAENRRRFHLEVIRKIHQVVGTDFPLMIKFGVQDDREGGLSLSEGLETARQMVAEGIDAIEVSAGVGNPVLTMRKGESPRAYYRERAAAVKRMVTVPVILVGGIRSFEMAKDIVSSGDTDLISMCRPFIREPDLVARWQRGDTAPAKCISCNKCMARMARGELLGPECFEEHRPRGEVVAGI